MESGLHPLNHAELLLYGWAPPGTRHVVGFALPRALTRPGEHTKKYGKPPCFMGKSTISSLPKGIVHVPVANRPLKGRRMVVMDTPKSNNYGTQCALRRMFPTSTFFVMVPTKTNILTYFIETIKTIYQVYFMGIIPNLNTHPYVIQLFEGHPSLFCFQRFRWSKLVS